MTDLEPHIYPRQDELGLLGACLVGGIDTAIEVVAEVPSASLFSEDIRQTYALIESLASAGSQCDLPALAREWNRVHAGLSVPIALWGEAQDSCPSASNAPFYIKGVLDGFRRRSLINGGALLAMKGKDAGVSIDELIGEAEALLVSQEGTSLPIVTGKEGARQCLDAIQDRFNRKGAIGGVETGFYAFDNMIDGLQLGEQAVIAARPSIGKAQPVTSKVLTPCGFVPIGSLVAGSIIIGLDGKPYSVTGVYPQGVKKVNRVKLSDGTSTKCCDEHLWLTQTRLERRRSRSGGLGSVKTTAEIRDTLRRQDGGFRNHALPILSPVEFSGKSRLPLHPWLLGALIGDGSLTRSSVQFHKPEGDIQSKLIDLLPSGDSATVNGMAVNIKGGVTLSAIRSLGLRKYSEEKFIPSEYLFASTSERIELLQGLIDTDGFCRGNSFEYSTSSERLMNDFAFLVRSLGGICMVSSRIPHYTYKGERLAGLRSWRAGVSFHDHSIIPASSRKHLSRFKTADRQCHRSIIAIEECGYDDCVCISVDSPDCLYVTDDFIPTHNTAIAMSILETACLKHQVPTLFITLEMSVKALTMRMASSWCKIPLKSMKRGDLLEKDFRAIAAFSQLCAKSPLHFANGVSGMTISNVCAIIRRSVRKHGVKLVIVDYLQKVLPSEKHEKRTYEVAEVSSRLKGVAERTGVAMLTLAQLSRESEKDKRTPRLSDLADSAQIEKDADLVALLHRERGGDKGHEAALIVAKQRDGETGVVPLHFDGAHCKFSSVSSQEDYEEQAPRHPN